MATHASRAAGHAVAAGLQQSSRTVCRRSHPSPAATATISAQSPGVPQKVETAIVATGLNARTIITPAVGSANATAARSSSRTPQAGFAANAGHSSNAQHRAKTKLRARRINTAG